MHGLALIGPPSATPATVGTRVARRLGRPHVAIGVAAIERAVAEFPGAVLSVETAEPIDARARALLDGWLVLEVEPSRDPVEFVADELVDAWWASRG